MLYLGHIYWRPHIYKRKEKKHTHIPWPSVRMALSYLNFKTARQLPPELKGIIKPVSLQTLWPSDKIEMGLHFSASTIWTFVGLALAATVSVNSYCVTSAVSAWFHSSPPVFNNLAFSPFAQNTEFWKQGYEDRPVRLSALQHLTPPTFPAVCIFPISQILQEDLSLMWIKQDTDLRR